MFSRPTDAEIVLIGYAIAKLDAATDPEAQRDVIDGSARTATVTRGDLVTILRMSRNAGWNPTRTDFDAIMDTYVAEGLAEHRLGGDPEDPYEDSYRITPAGWVRVGEITSRCLHRSGARRR